MATTTAVSPAAPEPQPQMSAISRVFGVLFSPQKTFEDIVRKPGWFLPMALLTILSIAVSFAFVQRVNWREYISQQIEKSPQASQLSPEQKQQRVEAGVKFTDSFHLRHWRVRPNFHRAHFYSGFLGCVFVAGGREHEFLDGFQYYGARIHDGIDQQPAAFADFIFEGPEHDRR